LILDGLIFLSPGRFSKKSWIFIGYFYHTGESTIIIGAWV